MENTNDTTRKMKLYSMQATIIISLFYFFYFIKMIAQSSRILFLISTILMFIIGITSFMYVLISKRFKNKGRIIFIIFVLFLFGLISSFYNNNYRFQDYFLILQYIGIGLLLIRYKLNYKIISYFFFLYVFFFIYHMVTGTHPDNIFSVSRNNISVFMILQVVLLYISMYQNNLPIKLYPSIILVILCIWAIGRSGILVSIILLLGILLYLQIYNKKNVFKNILLIILLLSLFYIFINYFYGFINGAVERTSRLGMKDTSRLAINEEYLRVALLSFENFFFGFYLYDNFIFSLFGYNLHNSYARLHSFFGIVGVLIFFVLIVKTFYKYIKIKNYLFLLLFTILLIRMTTDIAAFHGPFDPLIYFFTMSSFIVSKLKYNSHKTEESRCYQQF